MEEVVETTEAAPILDPLDNPKVNKAAKEFGALSTVIKAGIKDLSLRSAQRLLSTLVEYPFIKGKSKPSKKEQELLLYILMAEQQKAIMLEAVKLSDKEIQEQIIEPIAQELTEKEKK